MTHGTTNIKLKRSKNVQKNETKAETNAPRRGPHKFSRYWMWRKSWEHRTNSHEVTYSQPHAVSTTTNTVFLSCLQNNNVSIPAAKLPLNLKVNRCLSTSNILHYTNTNGLSRHVTRFSGIDPPARTIQPILNQTAGWVANSVLVWWTSGFRRCIHGPFFSVPLSPLLADM